mgnify:CR=1 FL=1
MRRMAARRGRRGGRRSAAARRDALSRRAGAGLAGLLVPVVFWSAIWMYVVGIVVAAAVGGTAWWVWRTDRALRGRDREWREREAIAAPALVIGHQFDIVHPFSDAGMLAEELSHAKLMQAHSLIELRVAPKRLTNEIGQFLDECWLPRAAKTRARAS